ncbi:MAG: T9SS type A sorting domain-containing protein [Flavobacteriales bacterium]|nr:T9SS type A sorting domain-containing protein [Flavobacteriales bacterium]
MKKFYFLALGLFSFGTVGMSQVSDGGFESGAGGDWTEASTNFGTPICDEATCGTGGGPCVPNTGTFYCWFGGAPAVEEGSVEQSVYVDNGTTAQLTLMVKVAAPGMGLVDDRLEVLVDGSVQYTITSHDSVEYADYKMVTIDMSAYADGSNHTIRVAGYQSTTNNFNILADDVLLTVDGGVTSLFEFETGENEVIIYPNPANEIMNLQFRNVEGQVNVAITDITGKLISNEVVGASFGHVYEYSTEGLAEGSYVVTVTQNGKVLRTEKVMVVK